MDRLGDTMIAVATALKKSAEDHRDCKALTFFELCGSVRNPIWVAGRKGVVLGCELPKPARGERRRAELRVAVEETGNEYAARQPSGSVPGAVDRELVVKLDLGAAKGKSTEQLAAIFRDAFGKVALPVVNSRWRSTVSGTSPWTVMLVTSNPVEIIMRSPGNQTRSFQPDDFASKFEPLVEDGQ